MAAYPIEVPHPLIIVRLRDIYLIPRIHDGLHHLLAEAVQSSDAVGEN